MKRKKIMIDMDDVIVGEGYLKIINEFLGTDYKHEDFDGFYMQDIIPNKKEFFDFFFSKNLYDYCKINNSAIEVIKELNEIYDIYIGTSYIYRGGEEGSGVILLYKYNYLREKLPFLNPNNYVFTGDKSIIDCEIKIDDNPNNLKGAKLKIMYTAWHNKKLSDEYLKENNIIRVDNWKEIKKILIN